MRLDMLEAGAGEAVLLVAGFTQQLTDWDDDFCARLARRHRVIRFDNRDVGRSERATERYRIADLAADARGVLDALGIERAHVLGVSMGGMIVQQLAIDHPGRILSLTSVMSTTGRRADTSTTPEAADALASGPAHDEASLVREMLNFARICGSPDYPTPPAIIEQRARTRWSRGYDASGIGRQFQAIFAPGQDRTEALTRVRTPTLVIHGEADPLIGVIGGRATAAAVPDAELWVIPGMGHDLPAQLNEQITERLLSFWASAAQR